ncbi:hypothetical protein ACNTMW_25460 [Planosporangium sp. 12N6]|uniref:hypothetical protein n=1 Tax=Planosporangium spinosum TaxID=3402278 RepID=UPI003CE9349C
MLQVLPRMADEAPPEYVAFVARHLDPLRRDAVGVVGDEHAADLLYPEVLTDVAARWAWLELLRTRLHRPAAADEYLRLAFARRSSDWRGDEGRGRLGDEGRPVEVRFLSPDDPPWPEEPAEPDTVSWPDEAEETDGPQQRSSAATRLAPYLRPAPRREVGPLAEAAVAWWHAYEAHRRRVLTARLVALSLFILVVLRVQQAAAAWT